MFIDAANFSEQNTPADCPCMTGGGQQPGDRSRSSTSAAGLSQFGRISTPYPLWDGTDRVLVSLHALRSEPQAASSSRARR